MRPDTTRLRYVRSKDADLISLWTNKIGVRIQIYAVTWNGKQHYVWFVPSDDGEDIRSINLDSA